MVLKMKEFSKPAYDAVMNGEVNLIPNKFINTYKHWMENVKDWCLSRQLWWGHRIPAWYNEDGQFVVAETQAEAEEQCKIQNIKYKILHQDEDCLDTWASSWLWPISLFDGIENPDNPEINYYYPTNDLVTAPEILFFWIARMIIAGYEYRGQKPFNNVYLTGIVRDKQRRKMSKSLGNSPDPLDLIAQYGADGVRLGMLLCSPAGNDILFDESQVEQGRNFSNKLWNAFRLLKSWEVDEKTNPETGKQLLYIHWFHNRFDEVINEVNDDFDKFRLSEGLMKIYKLVWDDFCSWYLEMVKPVYGQPIAKELYNATIIIFDSILRLLHPIMPFITEELWQELQARKEGDSICIAEWPKTFGSPKVDADKALLLITEVRAFRNSKGISPKESVELHIISQHENDYKNFEGLIMKLANVSALYFTTEKYMVLTAF